MGQKAESNRFYQEREKAASEFIGGHKAIRNAVGARGFTILPGYYDEAVTDLELKVKRGLSAANFAILSEAVERELKQTGHDYDISVKNARIAWEIEKQNLLSALAKEFADLKKAQADTEEELNRRAIEIQLRESFLIVSKTEIGLEMERLKRELQATDRLTWNKEFELTQAKLVTAQAKLAVIPILEQIIAAEAQVLAQEEVNIVYAQQLAAARQELIGKKEELIPYLRQKAEKQIELAAAIIAEIQIKKERIAVSLAKAMAQKDRTDAQAAVIEADTALEGLRLALVQARNLLRDIEDTNRIAAVTTNTSRIIEVSTTQSDVSARIRGYEKDTADHLRSTKLSVAGYDREGDLIVSDIAVEAANDMRTLRASAAVHNLSGDILVANISADAADQARGFRKAAAEHGIASDIEVSEISVDTANQVRNLREAAAGHDREGDLNVAAISADVSAVLRTARQAVSEYDLSGDIATTNISTDANVNSMKWISFYRSREMKEKAKISATAKITSQLTHLLAG